MLKYVVIAGSLAFSLAACAPMQQRANFSFSKPGGSYDAYLKTRYACMEDARTMRSGAFVYNGIGAASSHESFSLAMFTSCMSAQGWQPDPTGRTGFRPPVAVYMQ